MSKYIVTCYKFLLVDAATETEFVTASAAVDKKLLGLEGFVYRSLAKAHDGQWLDCVYWESKEACDAVNSMMENEVFLSFMAHIDSGSVEITQAEILSQVYPEMQGA